MTRWPLWELLVATLAACAIVWGLVQTTEPVQVGRAAPGHGPVPYVPHAAPPPARAHLRAPAAPDRMLAHGGARLRSGWAHTRHVLERRLNWHSRKVRQLRRQIRLLRAELQQARHTQSAHAVTDWVARQIAAADTIARESAGDPWPNCRDPYDGSGANWSDTVNCENGGNWMDSPGYYRCGLQFDPMWERRFGRLCP